MLDRSCRHTPSSSARRRDQRIGPLVAPALLNHAGTGQSPARGEDSFSWCRGGQSQNFESGYPASFPREKANPSAVRDALAERQP
jgi:hypothetical protein